ncbi:MAG: RNA polymerase factor sigma-32 [Nitrospinae bacterium]|nr:RNA polymerase factor sigma-32 [Nitrospinota bacterium]
MDELEKIIEDDVKSEGAVLYDPLTAYMVKVKMYPFLTKEEEYELAIKYRTSGDKEAAYRLVTSHLILVVKTAMRFSRMYSNIFELIQEGNIGLLEAVKRFDPFKGARLSTYATWWIRAFILKYIVDNLRIVKVGTTNIRRKLLFKLQKEIERLELEGYNPHTKMLAEHFGATEEDIIDIGEALSSKDVSLDAPIDDNSKEMFVDTIESKGQSPEDGAAQKEFKDLFYAKLSKFEEGLNEYEREILKNRILSEDPATLQEIGDKFKVTREAVRQAEKRLNDKLKRYLQSELPK